VRFLTPDEEQRLMDAARLQSWVLLPLLIRLAIVTGLRRGALLGFAWGDVILDTESPHVAVERTKNGDSHVSPLTPDLVQEFRRMRRIKAKDSDLIFVRQAPGTKAHDFRHGFNEACKLAGLKASPSTPCGTPLQPPGTGWRRHPRHCRTCRTSFADP
jgi:integrase